ncbi:glycosyltransferase family 2 protein [Spiribacter roseus]|uniref:glycosyltransferase family 2 protein n=1 Tax=Spiribacter roseus TaxID=1855875 RepID=UPI00133007D0|nr:glycosyltransferase family 2 protein [Spiribacter roseus]KAF0284757.1 glycosyl transferase [Spiribacter roseus]
MRISIITAVYNRATTLPEALDSLRRQTHPSVEHVVQDGGSTDGTLQVLRANPSEEMKLVSAPDGGIYDAVNCGIARASGDVIGLLHSDDYLADSGVIADVAEALADPAVDGVYGDLDYVAAADTSHVIRRWRSGQYVPAKLKRGWMPPHPTLYLRRQVLESWGYYDTSFHIAADYEAMLRWLVRGQIQLAYIPRVLVKMRVGGESNRSLGHILRKSREDYRAMRRHGVGGIGSLAAKNFSKLEQFLPGRQGNT